MNAAAASPALGAIVLAGGRATRVDGEIKPLFEIGGRALLARAVDAARRAGSARVTVVAPVLDPRLEVDWVREDPPFGGPAAGVVAALEDWAELDFNPGHTLLLAADLPLVDAAVPTLLVSTEDAGPDGLCLGDSAGRPQWLLGRYRTEALARAAAQLDDGGRDASMRALLADLTIEVVAVDDRIVQDVDTWDDLARIRAAFEEDS